MMETQDLIEEIGSAIRCRDPAWCVDWDPGRDVLVVTNSRTLDGFVISHMAIAEHGFDGTIALAKRLANDCLCRRALGKSELPSPEDFTGGSFTI